RVGRRHGGRLGAPGRDAGVPLHTAADQLARARAPRPVPVPRGCRGGRAEQHPGDPRDESRARPHRPGHAPRRPGSARWTGSPALGAGLAAGPGRKVIVAMTDEKKVPTDHELRLKSIVYRRKILEAIVHAGAGHTGGSLSCIDILNVLYNRILRVSPETF